MTFLSHILEYQWSIIIYCRKILTYLQIDLEIWWFTCNREILKWCDAEIEAKALQSHDMNPPIPLCNHNTWTLSFPYNHKAWTSHLCHVLSSPPTRVLSAFKEGLFAALPHWSLKSEAKSDKVNQALGIKRLFYKSLLIASQPGPFFHFQNLSAKPKEDKEVEEDGEN